MNNRKIAGFAIMLISAILMIGFNMEKWYYIGDFSLTWPMVWMITAIAGFICVVWKNKKSE